MKQVFTPETCPSAPDWICTDQTDTLQDSTFSRYYGVKMGSDKCFITRENYIEGDYKLICVHQLTEGNGYDCYRESNIRDMLNAIITGSANAKVYQFDTSKELFAWLAE